MAVLLLFLLISALAGGSDAAWCVCRADVGTVAQQRALDYACGNGADCSPILQNGSCYDPNTVANHCSYAVNSYYQRQSQAASSCDFAGTASLTNADPSPNGCSYPANSSAAGVGNTPAPPPPGSPTSTLSPPTGVLGLSPTATPGISSTDGSGASGAGLLKAPADSLLIAVIFSGLGLLGCWR